MPVYLENGLLEPDLNPVDCYFWGLVKTLVYNVVEINDEDEF